MGYSIHTGNSKLAGFPLPIHGREPVPFALDETMPDDQVRLYCDGAPIGRPMAITPETFHRLRETITRQAPVESAPAEPETEPLHCEGNQLTLF